MIYLDAAAVVKMVRSEAESVALVNWLNDRPGASLVSSALVRATAAAYADQLLRSLDAIHLATAQILSDGTGAELEAFVTYDRRLLKAAAAVGLPTASPS